MVSGLFRRQILLKCMLLMLNELPVKASVCVNEDQDKLPTGCIGYISFTKNRAKLDLLLILVLVLPLNFLNY